MRVLHLGGWLCRANPLQSPVQLRDTMASQMQATRRGQAAPKVYSDGSVSLAQTVSVGGKGSQNLACVFFSLCTCYLVGLLI